LTDYEDTDPIGSQWFRPFGVTTPRVGPHFNRQDSDYPGTDHNPVIPIEVEDRGQRTESGDETIWKAYEEGY
jgi:hypothetical protein